MAIEFIDNSEEVLSALHDAVLRALERCGLEAEGYAKDLAPYITGRLRGDISHKVSAGEQAMYVGTDTYYAPYVELGTGKYATGGGGRPDPWVYQDGNGKWHHTHGQRAQPFLKPSVANHKQTYQNIINDELKNA